MAAIGGSKLINKWTTEVRECPQASAAPMTAQAVLWSGIFRNSTASQKNSGAVRQLDPLGAAAMHPPLGNETNESAAPGERDLIGDETHNSSKGRQGRTPPPATDALKRQTEQQPTPTPVELPLVLGSGYHP